MRLSGGLLFLLLFSLLSFAAYDAIAQCTVDTATGFGLPASACPDSPVALSNPAPSANAWEWYFCTDALEQAPSVTEALLLDGSVPTNPQLLLDGNNYYLFTTSRETNELIRVRLGNSPLNAPQGIPQRFNLSFFDKPEPISFIQENGQWYAIVANTGYTGGSKSFVRLSFGNSLGNTPTATSLGDLGLPALSRGLKLVKQGGNYYMLITNATSNKLYVVKFGSSITNNIDASSIIQEVSFSAGDYIWNVDVFEDCGRVYAWVLGLLGNKIYLLDFAAGLENTPTVYDRSATIGLSRPGGSYSLRVGEKVHTVFLSQFSTQFSTNGEVKYVAFSGDITSTPMVQTQNTSIKYVQGITGYFYEGILHLWAANYNTRVVHRLSFDACDASDVYSTDPNPMVSYHGLGSRRVVMVATQGDGTQAIYEDNLNIDNNSIVADFSFSGQCLGATTVFTNNSAGNFANISQWTWDFGDGSPVSNAESPVHTYASAGNYTVTLTAQALNGCVTTAVKTVSISDALVADFQYTGNACVNNELTFEDMSTWSFNPPDAINGYYWDFGDGTYAVEANPQKIYTAPGDYLVQLTIQDAGGCMASVSKTVSIIESPVAYFEPPALICQGSAVQFFSQSTGSITAYEWAIDGQVVSTEADPFLLFSTSGMHEVSLRVFSPNGCDNLYRQNVDVKGLPVVLFTSAPSETNPLSIDFFNQSSGGVSFIWDFGDGSQSTAVSPSHVYALPGIYRVELTATSVDGCSSSFAKDIEVGKLDRDLVLDSLWLPADAKTAKLTVTNNGNIAIASFKISLTAGGELVADTTVSALLNSGQSQEVEVPLSLTGEDLINRNYLCASVDLLNYEDAQPADNEKCIPTRDGFYVYTPAPNPANQSFRLRWVHDRQVAVDCRLYDTRGEQVWQYRFDSFATPAEYEVNTSSLPAGLYFLKISDGQRFFVYRIIIQR
ncbi:PKD domain-containing protein [Thermonema rossianum]|uniref:PKD domain-containing protein n=1 Tax=Thermonema rossianum TaxID=55505 RepID=UPI00056EECC2|nr:PKD domain-containing protein [Thermonema rossianum]